MPAYLVANRYQDVLAANAIARALSPGYAPGQNFLRGGWSNPPPGNSSPTGTRATDIAVSGLREVAGTASNDPRMRVLVDELSTVSERFRLSRGLAHMSVTGRNEPLPSCSSTWLSMQAQRPSLRRAAHDHLPGRSRQPDSGGTGSTSRTEQLHEAEPVNTRVKRVRRAASHREFATSGRCSGGGDYGYGNRHGGSQQAAACCLMAMRCAWMGGRWRSMAHSHRLTVHPHGPPGTSRWCVSARGLRSPPCTCLRGAVAIRRAFDPTAAP